MATCTLYVDTGGVAGQGSGTTDEATAPIVLTINAGEDFANTEIQVNVTSGTFTNIVTSGANQSAIYWNSATNANKKIFWISAINDAASPKTITVDVIPTGLTAGTSVGYVGGWYVQPANVGLSEIDAATGFKAGIDVIYNNTPATANQDMITTRAAGTNASGFSSVRGKTGTRPILAMVAADTDQVLELGAFANWKFQDLELQQSGASGNCVTASSSATNVLFAGIKVTDSGAIGMQIEGTNQYLIGCEIAGCLTAAFSCGNSSAMYQHGNYLHDCGGDGRAISGTTPALLSSFNIIENMGGRGTNISSTPSSTPMVVFQNDTVAFCNNSGLETNDLDMSPKILNCIFAENGNVNTEYNVEQILGTVELLGFHMNNTFYQGGRGGTNLLNLTVNANVANSEFTTDPLFTATGQFTISSVDVSADTFTCVGHTLTNGMLGTFSLGPSGALPTGVAVATPYYVVGVSGNTFQVSLTVGGAAINITGTMTATIYFHSGGASNYGIGSTSPAKATGFPGQFLGGVSIGYLDQGAVQRAEPAAGSGGLRVIGS